MTNKNKKREGFKAMVDNAKDSIFVVSKKGIIVYANKKAAKMTGHERGKLIGKSIGFLVQKEEFKKISEKLRDRMAGKNVPSHYESKFVKKNGQVVFIEIAVTLINWQSGIASFALVRDITKQKRRESLFEEEEIKLEALISNLPCLVWFKDLNSRYLRVNDEFLKKVNSVSSISSKKGAIIGKKTGNVWPLGLAKRYIAEDKKVLKDGKIINTEEIIIKKDKEMSFYEATKGPIKNRSGKTIGVFGINHDVTEYKLTEKALKESQRQYQDLVENINDIIFNLDSEGIFAYISPVVEKITGYKPQEVIGHSFVEFIHPHDLLGVKKSMKDAMKGNVYPYEFRILCKDGSIINIRSFGRPMRDKKKIVGIIGLITDITESKKMEVALQESEEKLRNIVEDLPSFICRFLPSGKITFVNENYCKYFNKKKEDLLGKNFFNLLSIKNRFDVKKRFTLLTPERPILSYEYQSKSLKQKHRWQDWTNRAIFDESGNLKAYQTVGRDITRKKESEQKLLESYKYLGTINRQMSVLLGLNNVFEEKDKEKIIDSILWSALEISSSRFSALYKCEKNKKCFHLQAIVSKKKIKKDQKSKISTIFSGSNNFFNHVANNGNEIFKCPKQFQLKKFKKIDGKIKCYSILPLTEKNEVKGLLILGSSSDEELNDQEKNFYKIFSMYAALLLLDLEELA